MIFERMSANVFRKVRQIESLSKISILPSTRTSTSLASINRCLNANVINTGNNRFLAKFPETTLMGKQFNRNTATTGDHVRLWVMEKVVSAALPVVIPAAILLENSILDALLSVLVVAHTHWGLEAIIVDYARPSVVGSALPKILHLGLILMSACTLAGLFLLINNGPGVAKVIKDFWAIGKKSDKKEDKKDVKKNVKKVAGPETNQ